MRRVTQWIWRHEDNWPDWLIDLGAFGASTRAIAWIECLLRGHEAVRDQCGMPEHDFCGWCQKSMPGQANGAAA